MAAGLLLVATTGFAQAPRVYRDRVDAHWFPGDAGFWYRVDLADGQREFLLVDTEAGTRRPAFDHEKVAVAMSEASGTNVSSMRLPIDALQFNDNRSSVLLTGKSGTWTLNLTDHSLQKQNSPGSNVDDVRLFLPHRPSRDRGGDVSMEITNRLSTDLQLIWIDRSGSRKSYGTVAAGKKHNQHTFVGHVWLVQTDDEPLACFEAVDGTNEITLSDATLKTVRRNERSPTSGKRESGRRRIPDQSSPDGRWMPVVINHNLHLKSIDDPDSAPRPVSTDATADFTFRRDASRSRLLEMQYERSDFPEHVPDVRWSPDSNFLLAMQTRRVPERRVQYLVSSPKEQLHPVMESYPYAKPGDAIPNPTPRLFALDEAEIREIPISKTLFPNPFSLRFLKFSDDGLRFWLLYNERGHQVLRVLEVTVTDGAVRAIVDEHSDTFVHYSTAGKLELEWLPDNQLLWASERSGWNHLHRYDLRTGQVLNAVTSGDWNVRRIEHIDRDAGVIWFYAVGIAADQDPYHEHFCKVHFDGSGLQVLTEGDGTHEITWSPDRTFFLDQYSRVDLAPITELRRSNDGSLVTQLEIGDASDVAKAMGRLPERFVASGRDGQTDIWGIIHFPRHFQPDQKYPVVENIYAGPHDYHVPKAFRSSYRHQQQLTDRGLIVVQIDGMGTAWRSKAFHDVCYRNLKDAGFPDRIAWIKAAAEKFPAMDPDRVGIYGGSAGGQNAMAALLWHGTFYKAAVADCGCHDNRMDKLWWNEQWMGWPVDDHYAASSNTVNAHRLQGHLMLVVGEADRNVDPASTTQTVKALIDAGKDFDFLLMPGTGHGACEGPYASKRRADFLFRHLK
ncbi:MAG: prolyl oligopeptidase family serine peptidase [Planctomycetaceae bacterium]